ncbi:ABC transporter substrate-binding protein [Methanococcus maripaludis]|uniref:Iron complex transport system substrate-binding protein n=1 Tax=Methanococcus maripaludis TaxID=39152 RepID=A0A2L1CAI8_METMI|nr:ABC transporter substrate-binding protein [Methanococcus maripaludis]AVB75886.1 Periplasmic binding protein [Methanococcus maripaludis]MBA2864361.1 iron complex transport system substrate-binding protein [Methanococcus maripaludis]MBB6497286.1 iron complex transport system substrate-binding protein [Methanococcus maripaludis]
MKKIMALLMLAMIAFMPSISAQAIGDVNGDDSISIADVVYLFKHRNVGLDVGDLNCDNSVNVVDVVYLFKNYDTFRDPVVFAETFEMDPNWDNGYCYVKDSVGNEFVLLKEGATDPQIEGATVITAPINSLACTQYSPVLSTADVLNNADVYDTIDGIGNWDTTNSEEIYSRYLNNETITVGGITDIDYDKIAILNPDVVFLGSWDDHDVAENKLETELGIDVARFYTYDEKTYLGRIEWAKFVAAFWGDSNSDAIEQYFQDAWHKRNELIRTASTADDYPTVVYVMPVDYGGLTYYLYGSQNYNNKMITEFGGENIFNDIPGSSSLIIDAETFYERAASADVVIYMGMEYYGIESRDDLLQYDPNLASFESLSNGKLYIPVTSYYLDEAKDPANYMEDFARMIHPELYSGGDSSLTYFNKIE